MEETREKRKVREIGGFSEEEHATKLMIRAQKLQKWIFIYFIFFIFQNVRCLITGVVDGVWFLSVLGLCIVIYFLMIRLVLSLEGGGAQVIYER